MDEWRSSDGLDLGLALLAVPHHLVDVGASRRFALAALLYRDKVADILSKVADILSKVVGFLSKVV